MSDWHIGRITKTYIENTAGLEYNYDKGLLESVVRTIGDEDDSITQTYSMEYAPLGNMTKIQVNGIMLINAAATPWPPL